LEYRDGGGERGETKRKIIKSGDGGSESRKEDGDSERTPSPDGNSERVITQMKSERSELVLAEKPSQDRKGLEVRTSLSKPLSER